MTPRGPLLVDQLRYMATDHGDAIAYEVVGSPTTPPDTITFLQWERKSNQAARWLISRGINKGDRVALYMHSDECLQWICAYSAIHKAGAVMVPVNTRLSVDEVSTILHHAQPAATIASGSLLESCASIAAKTNIGPMIATQRTQLASGIEPSSDDWRDLESLDADELQVGVDLDDMADIMYTSGTTGLPKGVLVRHRNVAMIPNSAPTWTGRGWLHGAPLFTFAGMSFIYNPMKMGLSGLYLPKFDVQQWCDIVATRQPMMAFLVPAMAELITANANFGDADMSSLLAVSIGSAPLAPATLAALQAKIPQASVTNSYGLTEAGPAFIVMPKDEAANRIGSVGKPMAPMQIKVVDPESETTCVPHEVGELLVRLPGARREYYRDDHATASTWTEDGWLRTGDLAYLDDDGFVYISGRIKDMIIRGGNNIYATDIEAVLLEHPNIQEAAVIGVPHKVLGEDVGAFVVVKPGAAIADTDIVEFCAPRLADYKRPRHVWVVAELPRNATGKVMKHKLREHLNHPQG